MTTDNRGRFRAQGLPVLIGSLPLDSHETALEWIFRATPEIPLWPQLPANPYEQMLPQFAENIPCITEENAGGQDNRIYFDTNGQDFEPAMLAFYEEYLQAADAPDTLPGSRFTVSRERAAGLYLLADRLPGAASLHAAKGQITGPFTLLTGIKNREGRAGYYDETTRDMVIKSIALKAAWQAGLLAGEEDRPVLLFIDEPALAGLGSSAFISVSTAEIGAMINEVAAAVHKVGGLAGIHVCANTDWNLLLASDIDILSFDAYGYFDRIAPLKAELNGFLDRGGIIAWGGIPTSNETDIRAATAERLCALWEKQMDAVCTENRSIRDILSQTLITPSCGTGSLTPELADRVLNLTRDVSAALRQKYL